MHFNIGRLSVYSDLITQAFLNGVFLVHCVREYQKFEALMDIQCATDGWKIKGLQRGL